MSMEVFTVTYPLYDAASGWQGDDVNGHIMKAPAAADGGGITILRAYAINHAATGAGTAFTLKLLNYGTTGATNGGTIGSCGGTADLFVAGTPKEFTLTAAQKIIDAGEWIVLNKTETNSSDPTRASVVIEYVMGQ